MKDEVFSMDGGSAPGTDGFSGGRIRVDAELPTYLLQKNQTIVVQFSCGRVLFDE